MRGRLFPRLGPRKTLTELVHHKLRVDIIQGRVSPGEFISTGKIAEAMGISSMPVRAALTRLETEGLVTIIPQRGVKVSAVSVVELRELFIIRSRLEGLAAHLACPRLAAIDFQKLRRLQGEMAKHAQRVDAKAWLTANAQWHQAIFQASGNAMLTRLLFELYSRGMSRRVGSLNIPGHMDRRLREHEDILAALERRDAGLVERLWRDHILAGGEEIIKYLETAQIPTKVVGLAGGGGDGLHNTRGGGTPATDGPRLRGEGG